MGGGGFQVNIYQELHAHKQSIIMENEKPKFNTIDYFYNFYIYYSKRELENMSIIKSYLK